MARPVVQHTAYKKGATGTARKHADYIAGVGKNSDKEDVIFLLDANVPAWAKDAGEFFSAADEFERGEHTIHRKAKDGTRYEKTARGRAYIEFEWSIQRDIKDPIGWAIRVAKETLGTNFVYRLAVHDAPATDGGRNINMHLMFSDRKLDGIDRTREQFFTRAKTGSYRHRRTGELIAHDPATGGAAKDRFWNHRSRPKWARELYAQHVQRDIPTFQLARSASPEPKIGPVVKKGGRKHANERRAIESLVHEMRALRAEIELIDADLAPSQPATNSGGTAKAVPDLAARRWQEFKVAFELLGASEFGLSRTTIDLALAGCEDLFQKVADAIQDRGEGMEDLARMLIVEMRKNEPRVESEKSEIIDDTVEDSCDGPEPW